MRIRRPLVAVVALAATCVGAGGAAAAPSEVVRRAGADRYATSAAVSAASGTVGGPAYVASGTVFADALAAAPIAGRERAPVLLVTGTTVPVSVADELRRLRPNRITVLGGPGAVSDAVVADLDRFTDGPVERRAGADRYATAASLSAQAFEPGAATAFVAGGETFPDALSAGAAAVGRGPVLLVTRDAIPSATAGELRRLAPRDIVVIGGRSAVSDAVVAALDQHTTGTVTRRAGADRFATSVAASQGGFDPPSTDVYVASGRDFADALAGAWAAGAGDSPVLLAERTCVPGAVADEVDRLAPQRLVLLGGTAVLDDAVGRLQRCTSGPPTETVIATGLDVPWDVAFVPGGRAYLTENNTGRVLLREADAAIREVHRFAVDASGEGGLLGLEASPTFGSDGLLYAYLTSATDNRVVRFTPGGAVTPILTGISKAAAHDAGRIAFGPDGMLYVATGDAGVSTRSQDPTSLNGKVLRVRPDGTVPADNPRAGSPVYALGLRDPQGLAWDRSGRLYATEFGPDRDDEVNVIVPNGNYGWPAVTGRAGDPRFVDPIVVRQPAVASWSGAEIVAGGVQAWDGDLLVAALRGTRLYRFDLALDGTVVGSGEELWTGRYGRLRHVEQAPDGSLWVLTSNRDGRGNPVAADDRIIRVAAG